MVAPTRTALLEGEGLLVLKEEDGEALPVSYRLAFRPQLGDSGSFRGSGTLTLIRPEGAEGEPPTVAMLPRVGRKATLQLADGRSIRVLLTSSDGTSLGVAIDSPPVSERA